MPFVFLGAHLLVSAAVAALFGWQFGAGVRATLTHVLLVAEWDLMLVALATALRRPRQSFRVLLALTCTLQVYLYALNLVSNLSWDRNMTAHLVAAFAPTVLSGREPFPIGPVGIVAFLVGVLVVIAAVFGVLGRSLDEVAGRWRARVSGLRAVAVTIALVGLFGATMKAGVDGRDNLYWKGELVSSFFRQIGRAHV